MLRQQQRRRATRDGATEPSTTRKTFFADEIGTDVPSKTEEQHRTEDSMPKQKTHSGAKKRFKVSGSGKIMRQKAGRRHLLEHKSSRRTRRLDGVAVVTKADVPRMKRLLGI